MKRPDITIAITTVSSYYKSTIPRLIQNLQSVGIANTEIVVFVNESTGTMDDVPCITHYHSCEKTYFEWLPFKMIFDHNLRSGWWFFIHDTVQFGCEMVNLLVDRINNTPYRVIKLTRGVSNNMGVMRNDYINDYMSKFAVGVAHLESIETTSVRKTWVINNEIEFL
jgi:hypothetical protein